MPIVHPDILALKAKTKGKLEGGDHNYPAREFPWGRHWDRYVDPSNKDEVYVRITRESEGRGQFGSEEDHDLTVKTIRARKGSGDAWSTIFQHDLREAKNGVVLHPKAQGKEIYWQIYSYFERADGSKSRWDMYLLDPKDPKKGRFAVRVVDGSENQDLSIEPISASSSDELRQKIYEFEKSAPPPAPTATKEQLPGTSTTKMPMINRIFSSKKEEKPAVDPNLTRTTTTQPQATPSSSRATAQDSGMQKASWISNNWVWLVTGLAVATGGGYLVYRANARK